MSFLWTTLHVKNLETSLSFYKDVLGLSLERRFSPSEGMSIAFLGNGETKVELIESSNNLSPSYGQDFSMGFSVPSLKVMYTLLEEKGIPILAGPFSPNPSIRFIYVRDPDGLKIQLVEKV